jgi:hypothetical protein
VPQERRELIGHVRRLLAELAERDANVALVQAEIGSKVLGARHAGRR